MGLTVGSTAGTYDGPMPRNRRSTPRTGPSQLVVVANRLPVRAVGSGRNRTWQTSPGGLVSALAPVMADRPEAIWVGWTGSTGTEEQPFDHDGIRLHPVSLSRAEVQQFYEGFSNGTLWPLYHDAISQPEYHRIWWEAYVTVNQRYATAVADVADTGATVWVHDFQLQLVPALLRELRPDLRIGFFLHIPFPARELFLRLPWRTEIAEGLLGADLVGFQTKVAVHNFRYVLPRVTEASVQGSTITHADRRISAIHFPIGIDAERFVSASSRPIVAEKAAKVRSDLGDPLKVILGVDRLDYTKGIDRRLMAYNELLDEGRIDPDDTVMIQIAEPSRTNVLGYADIRHHVEQLVGEINGAFGSMGRPAVQYLHQSQNFEDLIALYRLADVMVVTPFRDGMNLVAKEYVACRTDNTGSLVLSEFAGAADELGMALQVNPYDIEGVKNAIEAAVVMTPEEQARRMASMRRAVTRNTAARWASAFLDKLEDR